MREDYKDDLDAFELYHLAHESYPSSALTEALLPALRQAFSGALGTSVANILVYPLDLVVTRLKVQQRREQPSRTSSTLTDDKHTPQYTSIASAFQQIYSHEGGLPALYPGLALDTFKSMLDSFFLFLFYNLLRRFHRSQLSSHSSKRSTTKAVLDEIVIGVLAGAATKAMTTPLQNIVTRKQISKAGEKQRSLGEMATALYKSKGFMGFYSGYSATLLLTLNPSLCFMFDSVLRRLLIRRRGGENSGQKQSAGQGALVFLCAAMAKAGASAVTYPLSLAKARAQAEASEEKNKKKWKSSRSKDLERKPANVFLTLAHIAKTEGVDSLYYGVEGEVLKGFFSHGLTMLLKERLSAVVIRLYYAISVILRRQSRLTKT